jgi:hypothetical protein
LACLKCTGQQSGDPACLWIPSLTGLGMCGPGEQRLCVCWGWGGVPSLAGLRGTGLQSEYYAGLCRPWGHGPVEQRSCVFVSPCMAVLGGRGLAEQRSCRAVQSLAAWPAKQRPFRAGRHGPAKWSSCRAVPALGPWPSRTEIMSVCISGVAGLGGVYRQSRGLAGWCSPWGHGRQCRDSAGLGSVAQQDGAPAGVCRPWGVWPGRYKCLWILGPKGSSHKDRAVLRGGSLG